jgi:hypothetical protein
MAEKDKSKALLEELKGLNIADSIDWNDVEDGNREAVRLHNEEMKSDAIKMLEEGTSAEDLMKEMMEQGWDEASPIYKITKKTVGGDGDDKSMVVEETTIVSDDDKTKSFFKSLGKKHDEENHWKDYKPTVRNLSNNKNKNIIY